METVLAVRFNPRVRGTCLVRQAKAKADKQAEQADSFNPRVRGTCLVSGHRSHVALHLAHPYRFNPRVRGTCLVRELHTFVFVVPCVEHGVSIPVCGEHVW